MSKFTIRKIYLYLFSLVGLILIIMGSVGLINLGLQLTFFRDALEYKYGYVQLPYPYFLDDLKFDETINKIELTNEQKQSLERWKNDYENYKQKAEKIGYIPYIADTLTRSIALLIVGIPIYIYHWGVIKREHNKEENTD